VGPTLSEPGVVSEAQHYPNRSIISAGLSEQEHVTRAPIYPNSNITCEAHGCRRLKRLKAKDTRVTLR